MRNAAALTALCLLVLAPEPLRAQPETLRGYTIMAGGLGREPAGPKDMWSNTAERHLAFIDAARINLVVIEVPYGLSERFPKSRRVSSLCAELRKRDVAVWMIYPHVLAQTFDLPRQVAADGSVIEWNCCFNTPEVQDWLVENGERIAATYRPDALILFGTFHVGGKCSCDYCDNHADARSSKNMERFFARWRQALREVAPKIKLGTCDFWARASKKALAAVDIVCPVVPIFRPGYAEAGQVRAKVGPLRSRYRGKLVVPYVKLFLASQTDSRTEDVLAAAREGSERCDGFFFWGYNPGHSYARQDYDHDGIAAALRALADR